LVWFFKAKPVQTGLAQFFSLAWFFPVWLVFSFGFFGLGSVRFGFFGVGLIKPNWSVFFKILIGLIGFFSQFVFFGYCFLVLSVLSVF